MRLRFVAAFVGVMVVVLFAIGFPLANHLRDVESERLRAELQRDAFNLAGTAADPLVSTNPDELANLRASAGLYATSTGSRVTVTDASGAVVVNTSSEGPANVSVVAPVRAGARTVGTVRLDAPDEVAVRRADGRVRGLLLVGAISLGAAVIAALFMAGTVINPLRRLQRTTERVAAGEFDARSDSDDGPPEVRRLAASFDVMTDRIAHLLDQQRSFASDASHQLRTPLTALRLQLERAADTVETDPDGARAQLEAATAETERLQHMVEGLLLLARSDAHATATEVVDIGALVRERADIWRPLAAERQIDVQTHGARRIDVRAVNGSVEQIIDNFLDNAISVAPPGSVIEIAVDERGGWAEAHVLDRGPGLSDDQLSHVFDRFWRAPDASHDGSGLGLAIVRHLAHASGGSVALVNRIGGGIDASLRLPVQTAAHSDH